MKTTTNGNRPVNLPTEALRHCSYGFKELAVLYFPDIAPSSASVRLKHWIQDAPALQDDLASCGYHPGNRILSPRHVELITKEFGNPF